MQDLSLTKAISAITTTLTFAIILSSVALITPAAAQNRLAVIPVIHGPAVWLKSHAADAISTDISAPLIFVGSHTLKDRCQLIKSMQESCANQCIKSTETTFAGEAFGTPETKLEYI